MDVYEREEYKGMVLEFIPDEDPLDPRENQDNFGTMACAHRRYHLGDKDARFTDPDDFRRGLAMQADPSVERRLEYWEDGPGWERLQKAHGTSYGDYAPGWQKRFDAARADLRERAASIIDQALDAGYIMLPLFLYDHSGITMNTSGFHCPWDSGQVGWIYVPKAKVREEYSAKRISKAVYDKAVRLLKAEVEEYDAYISGDCWGWRIRKPPILDEDGDEVEEGEEVDSCWGYLGLNYAKEEARWQADHYVQAAA